MSNHNITGRLRIAVHNFFFRAPPALVLLVCWGMAGCEQLIYGEDAYLEELSHDELLEQIFRDGEGEGEGEAEEWQEGDTPVAYNEQDEQVGDAEQTLYVPAVEGTSIRVEKGDTLYSLSRRHGVKVADLAAWNGIQKPYVIKPGQTLRLAGSGAGSGAGSSVKTHKVRKGETAYAIARKHGVTIADLIAANDLQDASKLAVGQALRVGRGDQVQGQKQAQKPAQKQARRGAGRAVAGATSKAKKGKRALLPLQRYFIWPVKGKVIMGFGKADGGYHNDGINVASSAGTPVRVVEDGVVAYHGDEVKGFGNLVLVSHGRGWTSAYAHLGAIDVRQGQRVKRGAVLGRVGTSGHVSRSQLHFELRYRRQAVNPMLYMDSSL